MSKKQSVRWIAAVAAGLVISIVAFGGTAYAPASAPVRIVDGADPSKSANVDASGNLHVTGEVSVGGTSSVEVNNFPETQGLPPVTQIEDLTFGVEPGGVQIIGFSSMNVSSLLATESEDEVEIWVYSPLIRGGAGSFQLQNDHVDRQDDTFYQFPNPVPVNAVRVECENESDSCAIRVTLFAI
jgi:hypothetical protein